MVRLVQVIFRDGTVSEEIVWVTIVLLLKGKGGLQGHWDSNSALEGVLGCGVFSAEKECRAIRRASWVQRRERDRDGDSVGQDGTAYGTACARASLPCIPGCLKVL